MDFSSILHHFLGAPNLAKYGFSIVKPWFPRNHHFAKKIRFWWLLRWVWLHFSIIVAPFFETFSTSIFAEFFIDFYWFFDTKWRPKDLPADDHFAILFATFSGSRFFHAFWSFLVSARWVFGRMQPYIFNHFHDFFQNSFWDLLFHKIWAQLGSI